MRLYSVAVAHFDWSAYRAPVEEDGRVFLSASFERGLSVRDFPELPPSVRDSFPSVGVHPLLPRCKSTSGSRAQILRTQLTRASRTTTSVSGLGLCAARI